MQLLEPKAHKDEVHPSFSQGYLLICVSVMWYRNTEKNQYLSPLLWVLLIFSHTPAMSFEMDRWDNSKRCCSRHCFIKHNKYSVHGQILNSVVFLPLKSGICSWLM